MRQENLQGAIKTINRVLESARYEPVDPRATKALLVWRRTPQEPNGTHTAFVLERSRQSQPGEAPTYHASVTVFVRGQENASQMPPEEPFAYDAVIRSERWSSYFGQPEGLVFDPNDLEKTQALAEAGLAVAGRFQTVEGLHAEIQRLTEEEGIQAVRALTLSRRVKDILSQ